MEFIERVLKTFHMMYYHISAPFCSTVTCEEEDDVSASSDSLGEQLFELVDVYNTGHSQKITGRQSSGSTYAKHNKTTLALLWHHYFVFLW